MRFSGGLVNNLVRAWSCRENAQCVGKNTNFSVTTTNRTYGMQGLHLSKHAVEGKFLAPSTDILHVPYQQQKENVP